MEWLSHCPLVRKVYIDLMSVRAPEPASEAGLATTVSWRTALDCQCDACAQEEASAPSTRHATPRGGALARARMCV